VTARITDRRTGATQVVTADYLVAADGGDQPGQAASRRRLRTDRHRAPTRRGARRPARHPGTPRRPAPRPFNHRPLPAATRPARHPTRRPWSDAARTASRRPNLPLDVHHFLTGTPQAAAHLLDPNGAVLVRPDGFVAWRATISPKTLPATSNTPCEPCSAIDTTRPSRRRPHPRPTTPSRKCLAASRLPAAEHRTNEPNADRNRQQPSRHIGVYMRCWPTW
jgi:hypothetical protein